MAIFTEHVARRRHHVPMVGGGFPPFPAVLAWLGLAMMLCLSGCGGCRKTPEEAEQEKQQAEEKDKKQKEKEKDPFEARQPVVIPSNKEDFSGRCKPGHWVSQVWPEVKANRGDFQGELRTEIVDRNLAKVQLVAVPYEMTTERPAALAKEQPKSLEAFNWIPPKPAAYSVNFKLAAGGGPAVLEKSMGLLPMRSYQYYFVVLSRPASRYEYLEKKLPSIHRHRPNPEADDGPKYYEVVSMPASRRPSLPSHALYWTSIAYLLWDDFDPALWDVDQQRALIDWLHWGGQIIVSGPDALESLRNSFLRPYLPATVEKSRSFSAHELEELGYWAGDYGPSPTAVKPWPGADLKPDPQARYLPEDGKLLVERQVGRGRIVASAFRLTGRELTDWKGFDCFFNACLLRRPAREFPADEGSKSKWFHWAGSPARSRRLDAAKMTAVRYFSRDTGVAFESYASDIVAAQQAATAPGNGGPMPYYGVNNASLNNLEDDSDPTNETYAISPDQGIAPGLGAWNDFGPVAAAARLTLEDAAGVKVPERSFIVWVVLGYLCVLVPANWLVFRALGRVEWAWIAAPLIAIACTVVVIQQAQLNIGFYRSRNEIAVIEMQPGYSRVHVARYTALYTSLATRYEFRLDDPGGQILPFPRDFSPKEYKPAVWQALGALVCRRGDDTQLSGFSVASNAKDCVHSEEMADFGGAVTLHHDSNGAMRVTNGTKFTLDDCRVVQGGKSGAPELVKKLRRLEPGASVPFKFAPVDLPEKTPIEDRPHGSAPSGELTLERIGKVALDRQDFRPGEICLVARVVDEVPGLTVTPESRIQQTRQAALLVAHLDFGELRPPLADRTLTDSELRDVIGKAQFSQPAIPLPQLTSPFPQPATPVPGPAPVSADPGPQPQDPSSDDRTD